MDFSIFLILLPYTIQLTAKMLQEICYNKVAKTVELIVSEINGIKHAKYQNISVLSSLLDLKKINL